MASSGAILICAVGVACIFGGILLGKRKGRGKSTEQRLAECFADYEKQIEKFRK